MNLRKRHNQVKERRVRRVRARIFGEGEKPRLAVFRGNRSIYAQLIDDLNGRTLAAASSKELGKEAQKSPKSAQAEQVGALLAKKAKEAGIAKAVFDRRGYAYHGRVRSVAEGARKAGLTI